MRKKIITGLSLAAVLTSSFAITGCKGTSTVDSGSVKTEDTNGEAVIKNFEMPEIGEKIAVIKVKDYGEIKIKLFAEEAKAAAPVPEKNAVDNFISLADKDYYNELIFHRVIPNFMIQGGDPKGDGTGGNSTWGGEFDGGLPEGLYHFSGAVAYANSSGTSTDGSQFYIVDTPADKVYYGGHYDESGTLQYYNSFEEAKLDPPQNVKDKYLEVGGVPLLDGNYTVFGQVFEGLDIVRKISTVEVDENDKPLKQVQMESVTIEEYKG
jgi:cyclophilin family peptidyl-prolyl cis-trans isomerase